MKDSLKEVLEEHPFGGGDPSAVLSAHLWEGRSKGLLLLMAASGLGLLDWLAIVVLSHGSSMFDNAVPRYLHRYANAGLDHLASMACMLVTVISVAVLAWLLYRRRWRQSLFWFCSTAGTAVLCGLAKGIVQRQRPDLWLHVSPHATFSFPSGHAAQSMAIMIALFLLAAPGSRSRLLIPGLAFIGLIGICRIYLGLHYPTDILAGWALALSWVCLLGALLDRHGNALL